MQTPVGLSGRGAGGDLCHHRPKLRRHLREIHGVHADAALGHDNNVRAHDEIVLMETEKFPNQSFDPIALHGLAYLSAHRQPETPACSGVFPRKNKEGETL
jgi:hypothetical protein